MSSLLELDSTVDFLKQKKNNYSILQCTTAYPTKPKQYGLNMIQELKNRYNVPIGYSDHSSKIETCIAATALGAEILEFHAVFDNQMFGPDATSSLTIDKISKLVESVKNIKESLKNPVDKTKLEGFYELKNIFEKSLSVNKDLKRGHVLCFDDLEAKKPKGYGLLAQDYESVIGRALNKSLSKWDFLSQNDLV